MSENHCDTQIDNCEQIPKLHSLIPNQNPVLKNEARTADSFAEKERIRQEQNLQRSK